MKILRIDEMAGAPNRDLRPKSVNEAYMPITRIMYNRIDIPDIQLKKCTWDGEKWCYYERENKGTIDDFKALDRNKNANMDMEFVFRFDMLDVDGGYQNNICDVKVGLTLHYYNMANNDYEIEVTECENYEALNILVKEIEDNDEFDWEKFANIIERQWKERYVAMKVNDELEDVLGKQGFEKIIAEILDLCITEISDRIAE